MLRGNDGPNAVFGRNSPGTLPDAGACQNANATSIWGAAFCKLLSVAERVAKGAFTITQCPIRQFTDEEPTGSKTFLDDPVQLDLTANRSHEYRGVPVNSVSDVEKSWVPARMNGENPSRRWLFTRRRSRFGRMRVTGAGQAIPAK